MTNYTGNFAIGDIIFARRVTLVANTATSFFSPAVCNYVEIQNLSTADEVYLSLDGAAPTVNGNNCLLIAPGVGVQVPYQDEFKIISAGTPKLQFVGVL